MITPLEPRRLLSASLVGGALVVNATGGNDVITVSRNFNLLVIDESMAGISSFQSSQVASFAINAGAGNDLIDIKTSINRSIIIDAGGGDDTIKAGGSAGDFLFGGLGSDTVDYGARVDGVTVTFDTVANDGRDGEEDNVDESIDIVIGGRGDDELDATAALVIGKALYGNFGNDILTGSDFADRLVGGSGDDDLAARGGNDILVGIDGADTYLGGAGFDLLDLYNTFRPLTLSLDGIANDGYRGTARDASHGYGRANISTGTDIEAINGGIGSDSIVGSAFADAIYGQGGNDTILGGEGNDSLIGGAGRDRIEGNLGDDTIRGNAGDDTLYGQDGTDSLIGGGGRDTFTISFFGDTTDEVVDEDTVLFEDNGFLF